MTEEISEFVEGGLTIGQSNAGFANGEPGGPLLSCFDADDQIYMLSGKAGGSIGSETPDRFISVVERYLEPPGLGQTPAGMLGFARYLLGRQMDETVRPLGLHSSFRGSAPLTDLMPEAAFHIHENAIGSQLAMVEAFKTIGKIYSLTWIDFIQGEGGPFSDYASLLANYIENVVPSISKYIGQDHTPHFVFSQINSFTNADQRNPVALAQYEVARRFRGRGVSLAGPMYQYPFYDPGHLTDIARMMHGEVRALVLRHALQDGQDWHPLWPRDDFIETGGRRLVVAMDLPPGTDILALDIDWIPPVADMGFLVRDHAQAVVPIRSVSIDQENVIIDLDATLCGNGTLEYATHNDPGVEWWASGRGQIFADSNVDSPFHKLGYAVPKTVRHYATTFELPLYNRNI